MMCTREKDKKVGLALVCSFFVVSLVLPLLFSPPSYSSSLSKAELAYKEAKRSYRQLSKSRRMRRDRRNWIRVVQKFRKVYLTYPDDPDVAPRCLYMMARTYEELYGYSRRKADIREAIERYEVLVERFPDSYLTANALYALGRLYQKVGKPDMARDALGQLLEEFPRSRLVSRAKRRLAALGGRPAAKRPEPEPAASGKVAVKGKQFVKKVRYWSERDYTRVVIDTSGPVHFKTGTLPADRRRKRPKRYYIDISPAVKARGVKRAISVRDGLLKRVRVAQFDKDTVRVVFDLQKTRKLQSFFMENPFRIVVDAFGENYSKVCSRPKAAASKKKGPEKKSGKPAQPSGKGKKGGTEPKGVLSMAQQLGLCVRRVVIDAGHGGKDPGAIGRSGLKEKDVTLRLAKRVASILEKEYGMEVYLTRSKDRFVSLERRTAIANAKKADLFISIHVNSARNRRLRGVETYYLNFAVDESAMRVAARENAVTQKRIGELKSILDRIVKNAKIKESSRLAEKIQQELVHNLKRRYSGVKSLGVKRAPFFVLVGAQMPAALVEVSFISNRREEQRLRDSRYLDSAARGIAKGIAAYASDMRLAGLQ